MIIDHDAGAFRSGPPVACQPHDTLLKNSSLKTRITIAVVVLLVGVALLVTMVSFVLMKQHMRQLIIDQQSVLLTATARDIDQKFVIRSATLQALARDLGRDAAASPDSLQRALNQHASVRVLFDNLAVFSRSGDTLANFNLPSSRGTSDIAGRAYFTETVRLGKPLISPATLGVFSNQPLVVLTAPILDARGAVIMVLTGSIALQSDNFMAELAQTRIGKTGYFSVIDMDGTVIADRDAKRVLTRSPSTLTNAEKKALTGFQGSIDEVDRAGVRGLYSFKRLGATPWVLLAFYPDAEAFSVVAGLQRSALLLVLLVIAVIGPVAWLFVRHQLEPLQELQSRVLAIARQPTLALMPQV
ncbi:MAG: cache domain-containing protein, partial [Herminiimonas sp.]|nr:cache domain-containing protein [Herminiimonas sp.]